MSVGVDAIGAAGTTDEQESAIAFLEIAIHVGRQAGDKIIAGTQIKKAAPREFETIDRYRPACSLRHAIPGVDAEQADQ